VTFDPNDSSSLLAAFERVCGFVLRAAGRVDVDDDRNVRASLGGEEVVVLSTGEVPAKGQ
jgi:hypothetical protein